MKLEQAEAYEDVVRIAVTSNFVEGANGNIVSILRSQPDIEASLHPTNAIDTLGVVEYDRFRLWCLTSRSTAMAVLMYAKL